MRTIVITAAALAGLAVPAAAQNFTVPAGDSAFTRATAAQAYEPQSGFLALAPDAVAVQPFAEAPRATHHRHRLAR